ncbi:hypothetical protein VFPPC_18556 [Pochonia chlamydosporia 170]|uniref:Uncharacterized protein n=1 Tax=Pochonia chlamydosporia 170 TaxID=1380566 RepID=A0A219AP38_METCM|nr:hypothetical protein VFPPC_18556 [Pochonia chlamydosporia 170]OWT42322.1 hypothetical protein VFPPC_18556 [Pochonia chlamydosporia 170]
MISCLLRHPPRLREKLAAIRRHLNTLGFRGNRVILFGKKSCPLLHKLTPLLLGILGPSIDAGNMAARGGGSQQLGFHSSYHRHGGCVTLQQTFTCKLTPIFPT